MIGKLWRGVAAAALLALASCHPQGSGQKPSPHFVVGQPYQVGTIWRYPRAEYGVDISGLATFSPNKTGLTANGELADQDALTASHPTLQLPAILRVTNLENGRQILVRLNDRGPENPARSISLSRHAAENLGMTHDGTRVRVQMDDTLTRQLAAGFDESAPKIDIAAAPLGKISAESLAPPSGVGQSSRGKVAAGGPIVAASDSMSMNAAPVVLPNTYTQVPPHPGMLYIDAGSFSRIDYASILVNRLASLGAKLTTSYTAPRDKAYRIRIGPLFTLQDAEAMLARTIAAGVNDASIVVE